jgi:rubrerythrin
MNTSLFQVIAHEDANDQGKLRQAMALAHQRVEDRFGTFVRKGSIEDQGARYSLVEEDVRAVVAAACEQVGFADVDGILSSIGNNFITAPQAHRVASTVHEARKPKMCPYHSEVTDISLAAGDPAAGFNAMQSHAWSAQHCQGAEYKGDRCKFKPAMTTQAFWDEKAEKAEQKRQERAERQERYVEPEVTEIETPPEPEATVPETTDVPQEAEQADFVEHSEPSAIGEGAETEVPMAMAASTKTAAKFKCSDCGTTFDSDEEHPGTCPNCDSDVLQHVSRKIATPTTGLGGPSPKMDKSKWTPKTAPLPDVAEEDGGRWPTRKKDVTHPIKQDQGTRFEPSELSEIGDQVTERQDVTQKGGPAKTDQGGTFSGGERSAVSSLLPEDAVREALSKFKRD